MTSNYRKIGDFIQQVNTKNEDGSIELLLGVNLDKVFINSVANTIGTDMTKYKVIKKGQFGCKLMSVGRDKKLPISRLVDYENAIISSAYYVFEVVDENILNPEYLMMWFSRPESDRYLWFQSGGDVRGRITWDDLCQLPIKVPSIEKQNEIVAEYNTIVNRIKLNEQLNQKLEDTAQALYKHWFVNFEFPNAEGKPYKSSGGEMVYNEELDLEIPYSWEDGCLGDLSNQFSGFSFKGDKYSFDKGISVIRGENVTEQKLRWNTHKKWDFQLEERMKKCFLKANDVVIGMDGSKVGKNWSLISRYDLPLLLAQRVTSVRAKNEKHALYLYYSMLVKDFQYYVSQVQTGTSIPHISGSQISEFPILIPNAFVLEMFNNYAEKMIEKSYLNTELNKKLESFKDLLLSKMSKVETKTVVV